MQNLTVRLLALVLALGTLSAAPTFAAPSMQDDGDGVIEGYVFLDDDGDGALDLDEPGIEGITVRLEGEVDREVETDVAGGFGFVGLPDGDYDLIVEPGDDYATAELDRYSETIEGEQVLRLDFALAAVDSDAEEADEDDADEDMDDADEDMDDADEAMDASDDTSMNLVVAQLIDAMGEGASDEEIRMALESALIAAQAEGTESELADAIEQALADMDAEGEDADEDTADDEDDADEDADEHEDMDDDDADMASTEDDDAADEPDDMPAAGAGGPMTFGLMLVLLLAGIGGLGRAMERRQTV